ncbi:hypothetical protein [Algisphaera agarilytica]|uniref:Membrane transport protein MMPL domain-containing protein n=1 Tax=Algisphaera agarilytica TaxID=1385975 RepID=A0A7X0H9N7_9BACT|nr:hypothetical protein [Algisphaera agarilytica]MBB6431653.1 hypothetical protein [Algisphaera agarilytica]
MHKLPLAQGRGRVAVLFVTALLTAALAGFGIPRLSVTSLGSLFDASNPGEQRYAEYRELFDTRQEAIVLIDTGEAGEHEAIATEAAYALGESLEEEPKVATVHWGLNPAQSSPKLIRTLPLEDVKALSSSIAQLKPLLESDTPSALLNAGMARAMQSAIQTISSDDEEGPNLAEGAAVFVGLMDAMTQRMQTPPEEPVDLWAALATAAGQPEWELLRSASGRLLVLRVELAEGIDERPGYEGSLAALRRQVETIRLRFETLELGVTGYVPTSREAESVIRTASQRAVGGALIGILLLSGLAWRSLWLPVVAVALPGVSAVCTLGLIGLLLGEINALAMIGVVLAGLSSLYGGLFLAGACARGADRRTGIVAVGPVLALACLAVCGVAAWFIVWDEQAMAVLGLGGSGPAVMGLREAGLIAMLGMVLAWAVVVMVGTALLPANRSPHTSSKNASRGELAQTLAEASANRPRIAWALAVVVVAGIGASAAFTPRGAETSGFIPEQTEGAIWRERAWVEGGEWDMPLSILARGMEDAQNRATALRALPEVEQVTGIGRLLPEDRTAIDAIMNEMEVSLGAAARSAAALAKSPTQTSPVDLIDQVQLIRQGIGLMPAGTKQDLGDWHPRMIEAAEGFVREAESLDAQERQARLTALQRDYDVTRREAGTLVTGMLDPTPLTVTDLQRNGGLFASWYALPDDAAEDAEPWYRLKASPPSGATDWPSAQAIVSFHDSVREIEPEVTGSLERTMMRSGSFSTLSIALVAIAGLVLPVVIVLCGLGVCSGLGAGLGIVTSGLVMVAGVGWLSQPMTALSWSVWPAVGGVVVLWIGARVRRDASQVELLTLRHAAGGEAFGLVVAGGFLLAAGLRSAHAPGLTATAVAACLAIAIPGLLMLMLIPGKASPAGAKSV